MFMFHLYSEYAFKFSINKALTIGGYVGGLIGLKETNMYDGETTFRGYSVGLRMKKYAVHFIHETGQNKIRSAKFGVTYQL